MEARDAQGDGLRRQRYGKIRMLYSLEDPWEMASAREQHRFQETMTHLRSVAPHFGDVLELGLRRGASSVFVRNRDTLYGVDISNTAVRRAARRCPSGQFSAMPLEEVATYFGDRRFNLITACEVLYYATDIAGILTMLQDRTDYLYVRITIPGSIKMTGALPRRRLVPLEKIAFEDTAWDCFLWAAPSVSQA